MRRLRRMKAVPLVLLALMVTLLMAANLSPGFAGAGYLAAFAEAAIVGALADWFAVTALFRHPLGLPIPHTAIIPRRKNQFADNLAAFVREHFLNEDVLRHHLRETDLAGAMSGWSVRHRDELADIFTRLVRWLIEALGDAGYRDYLRHRLISRIDTDALAPLSGRLMQLMIDNRHHQELFTEGLRLAASFLDENKDRIRAQINQGSPWWLPGFIDDKIYDQMVERIQTQLLAMVLDPEHELRREFDDAMSQWAERLLASPETAERISERTRKVVSDPTVQAYFGELFASIGRVIEENLDAPGSPIRGAIRQAVGQLAAGILRDRALRERVNAWLEEALVYLIARRARAVTAVISETVRLWDGDEAARLIELQVGKDLQYIRINGTLVGGLIGLGLHAISGFF